MSQNPRDHPSSIPPTMQIIWPIIDEPSDEGQTPNLHDKDPFLEVEHQADDKPVDSESEEGEEREDGPTDDVSEEGSAHEGSQDESSDEEVDPVEDNTEGTCVDREGGQSWPF